MVFAEGGRHDGAGGARGGGSASFSSSACMPRSSRSRQCEKKPPITIRSELNRPISLTEAFGDRRLTSGYNKPARFTLLDFDASLRKATDEYLRRENLVLD